MTTPKSAIPTTARSGQRKEVILLALLCGLSLVPLWSVTFPPMVDLPQHAAQVSVWKAWETDGFDYSSYLWVNRRTPNLVANSLAFVLSWVLPVNTAFKVVISIAILGIPWMCLVLLRETGGDPWWALATVPLGYSYAFYFGFVSYLLATPVALAFLLFAWRYARRPTKGAGWTIILLAHLLFVTHPIPYGWAGLTGALMVATCSPGPAEAARRLWPFIASVPIPAAWILLARTTESMAQSASIGSYAWDRLGEAWSLIVGLPVEPLPIVMGLLFVAVPFSTGRASRDASRWIPFCISLALFAASPHRLLGTSFLYSRFAVFFVPTLLFALDYDPSRFRGKGRRWPFPLLSVVWIFALVMNFSGFRGEVGAFDSLLEKMEPNRRVLYLPLDRTSEFIPYPVFLHFGSWYQVERGGLVDFSFSEFFLNRFRYRPHAAAQLPPAFEWRPWVFDWDLHGGELYDYFLVRYPEDPAGMFLRSDAPVVPMIRATGGWWLFAREKPSVNSKPEMN